MKERAEIQGEGTPQLADIEKLYLHGRYLDAYIASRSLGPLHQWQGTEARILAAKLLRMLGDTRRGNRLLYLAWRNDKNSPRAFSYYARNFFGRNGLLKTLRLTERHAHFFENDTVLPELLSFKAHLHGFYRDFTHADALMAQALERAPENPWLHVEQSYLLEMEDGYLEAITCTDKALALVPFYRPAVQQKAHLLRLCGRDDEALSLLHEARKHLQSDAIEAQQLYDYQEREDLVQIAAALSRIESLIPLKSDEYEKWLAAHRCNLRYLQGDIDGAIAQAELNGKAYFQALAKSLRHSRGEGKRNRLKVDFVRQRHMTCGPATLAALSGYFGKAIDQQMIINSIWYGGTQDYDERKWALENGWHVVEFSLDWDSARALVDAGIPFAVGTVDADSAHLQALTGYDEQLGVFFIRDPFSPYEQEFQQQSFLDSYKAFGPRAMVMVPQENASLVNALNLPESRQYDTLYQIRDALKEHQRDSAEECYQRGFSDDRDSYLGLTAARELAWYDNNWEDVAEIDRLLLERNHDNTRRKLNYLGSLNRLGNQQEYRRLLEDEALKKDAHLNILTQYAELLSEDGRQQKQAEALLRNVLNLSPRQVRAYQSYAYLAWQQQCFTESELLYHIAASLEETDEVIALDYYRLARINKRGGEVLQWLHERFQRNAAKSSQPAITLYRAYEIQHLEHLGLEVLRQALNARPDDGDLLLYLSDVQNGNGNYSEADKLLAQAKPLTPPGQWLYTAARHAGQRHEHQRAQRLFTEVVENDPFNMQAHRQLINLLKDLHGDSRAIEYAREVWARFPNNPRIHEQLIDLLQEHEPLEAETVLKDLFNRHPKHSYARRQYADILIKMNRFDEAWAQLEIAEGLEPNAIGLHNIRGDYYARLGKREEAIKCYRETIRLSADNDYAINALMRLCYSSNEKKSQLDYLLRELMAQTTNGNGLLSYQKEAHNILPAEQLLATLREANQLRPDLWQTWSTLLHELCNGDALDEAETIAREAVQRFPLLPRCYLDLADVHKHKNDLHQQQQSLESALRISPHWDQALMELAENLERQGKYQEELEMLQAAVAASPSSSRMHVYLADALWTHERPDEALSSLQTALQLSPGYDWAWRCLRTWSKHLGRGELLEQTAREVARQKPGVAHSWYYLAMTLWDPGEKLEALDKAIECNPDYIAAYEEKIETLVQHERFNDARQVITDYDRGYGIPLGLRRYAPWMDYRRGEIDKAIIDLKALLEEEPGYYNGWDMLAAWCENNERPGDFLIASRQLAKLQPDNGDAWVRLGDALLMNDKREEAKKALQQALTLTPKHNYAGLSLFDLQLDDGELDAAGQTLSHQHTHLPPENQGYLTTRDLQLSCKRGELAPALEFFHQLTRDPVENRWYFDTAITAFAEAGWSRQLQDAFDEVVQDLTGINPAFATVWAQRQHKGSSIEWKLSNRSIKRLLRMGVAGHRVVDDYLNYLHELGSVFKLDRLIKRHYRELRKDPDTLASVGYILAARRRYKENAALMAGWRQMKELPAWALNNLAISLRELNRWDEQYDVLQRLLPMASGDISSAVRTWMSLESALRGDHQTVTDLFPLIDISELSGDNYFAYQLVRTVVEVEKNDSLPIQERLALALTLLRDGLRDYNGLVHNVMLWRLQHRVLWRLANRLSPMPGALYYWWRMVNWSRFLL